MFAASVVVLALNARGAVFEPTPINYFKAAICEKNVEKKCDLIEYGLHCLWLLSNENEKNQAEVDRLFTLYLGFLTADLPLETNVLIASYAGDPRLSIETRVLAAEALDGYLAKLRESKEDVPSPFPEHGGFTGVGHGLKPSDFLEGSFVRSLKNGIVLEHVWDWVDAGCPWIAIPPTRR